MALTIQDVNGQWWQLGVDTFGRTTTTAVSGPSSSGTPQFSTTVQNIVDATSQDIRKLLANSGADANILVDYVNRISLDMLRQSNWTWLESGPERFLTATGVNDYWVGTLGSNPAGSVDTKLNLSDVRSILDDTIYDFSNKQKIFRLTSSPHSNSTTQPDGTSIPYRPRWFKHNVYENASLLSIYPAPDNQNTYRPAPLSPVCTSTVSGALAARTYYVKMSFVDSAGLESTASATPTQIFVPANSVLMVASPPNPVQVPTVSGITYSQYRVYASTISGSETLQSVSTNLGTNWQEPNTGLVSGAALPASNLITPLGGYLIEFKYIKQRIPITSLAQVLQIPDDYKDIVVAGVNWKAFAYLKSNIETQEWEQEYKSSLKDIVRDRNSDISQPDFIRPGDPMSGSSTNYGYSR